MTQKQSNDLNLKKKKKILFKMRQDCLSPTRQLENESFFDKMAAQITVPTLC